MCMPSINCTYAKCQSMGKLLLTLYQVPPFLFFTNGDFPFFRGAQLRLVSSVRKSFVFSLSFVGFVLMTRLFVSIKLADSSVFILFGTAGVAWWPNTLLSLKTVPLGLAARFSKVEFDSHTQAAFMFSCSWTALQSLLVFLQKSSQKVYGFFLILLTLYIKMSYPMLSFAQQIALHINKPNQNQIQFHFTFSIK